MSKVDCGKARMRAESLVAIVQLKECGLDLDNKNCDKWKVWELFGDEGIMGGMVGQEDQWWLLDFYDLNQLGM